ncbi:MAG: Cys-Xaa-Xaa-Xaa repeat radical SAM target protein [Muribaculaceae bacterium]|nr:Cys-Xaa-Xaa-Xaa repeat radical SAM target protein [Muribaculaceae bacterium]
MKSNKNEELKSRRDFFKKAAKSALPILGAVVLASSPLVSKAAETAMGCNYGCAGACSGSCFGSCQYGCSSSCYGGCLTACEGCRGGCTGSCSGACKGSSYF